MGVSRDSQMISSFSRETKLKWENLLPIMGEGSPILSSGSFSDLIKAVLSTKSSNLLYKSGNNKALLD